jgi:mono/diheme cytochrome c family protein
MRVRRVRGAALAFTALFVVTAAVAARFSAGGAPERVAQDGSTASIPAMGDEEGLDGAALYAEHCALCHEVDELTPPLRGPDSSTAVLALLDFLDGHGEGGAAEDRAVARFLLRAAQ